MAQMSQFVAVSKGSLCTVPCAPHLLNLAAAKSCDEPMVGNCFRIIHALCIFFHILYSKKANRKKKCFRTPSLNTDLHPLCDTGWIATHRSILRFNCTNCTDG